MAPEKRRLAAIVSADVVGYSRLMGANETATLAALKAHRVELIDPCVAESGGRIVKEMGDGLLIEFQSVVSAVACSRAVQEGMAARNQDSQPDSALRFRIGVHLGDVIVEGEDIFGDGVNIAARLQEIATPGGIALSNAAFEHLDTSSAAGFVDTGEHELKNIRKPVRVWRWAHGQETASDTTASGGELALPSKPSIVVLPFDNLSKDEADEFLADGIAEDLITELSKIHKFFVIARTTSFAFKDQNVDTKQIARDLGVRYVLQGSVRRAGNRVRVSAQLSDAVGGSQVWAERYDRDLADIFDLQDELTVTIIGAVEPELGGAEQERARRKPPENLNAWEAYHRGIWHSYQFSKADNHEAGVLLQRATELDPAFATAWAGLSYVHTLAVIYDYSDSPADDVPRALAEAKKAVSLDDRDSAARFALGRALMLTGDLEGAVLELQAAIDLNPSFAQAHYGLGFALQFLGRTEEAEPLIKQAIRLSPHDLYLAYFLNGMGFVYLMQRRFDEAIAWSERGCRHPKAEFWSFATLATALAHAGRISEAKAALASAEQKKPGLSESHFYLLSLYRNPADQELYMEGLRRAGLRA